MKRAAGDIEGGPGADRGHQRADQYRDSRNLCARIGLHERFSTNKHGWQRWVFDQLDLPESSRVLELGCGAGALWRDNGSRIPAGWEIVLSDVSGGMAADARRNLAGIGRRISYAVGDAGAIPFRDEWFECVIANHMLYHVPSVERAVEEIHRVLRPGGRLFAAANGRSHLRELREMTEEFGPGLDWSPELSGKFSLESGGALLARRFGRVELHRYEDSLVVPEAGAIVSYVMSTLAGRRPVLSEEGAAEFAAFVETRVAERGAVRVTKETGMFEARRGPEGEVTSSP